MSTARLLFGIYPFSAAGMEAGVAVGAPDNVEHIQRLLQELQGDANTFIPRSYILYAGADAAAQVLAQVEYYVLSALKWDVVLCFSDTGGQHDGWLNVIRMVVQRYGSCLAALQIMNEPNLSLPGKNVQPNVRQALVRGVMTAKEAACASGRPVPISFNAVPDAHSQDDFWESLNHLGGQELVSALDYVGLNLYPDVFGGRIAPEHLRTAVEQALRHFRANVQTAGIPASLPIRITEHGWPTGPDRTYERQAEVLEMVIRTISDLREGLNITPYELFGLRDADSSNGKLFYQFGIVQDDYTPKPAFFTYRQLIAELSAQQ